MSSITDYVKRMSVHDVLARKSVHDVVALNNYYILQFKQKSSLKFQTEFC